MHITGDTGRRAMNCGNKGHSDTAVSEAIGAVMLISVVVLAVAIVGVVLTSQPPPQKLPAVSAVIFSNGSVVHIYHDGGDTLKSSELSILVNGNVVSFSKAGSPAPWTWSVGETLVNSTPITGTPQTVRIVYVPGSYTIASADFGYIGSGPVTTAPTPPTITTTPTSSPAPTVTGITPSGGIAGTTFSITSITGTNFVSGATAKLTRTGYADIPISGITVSSPILITGGSVNLAGAAAGPWNVVVTNPDTQSGSLSNGFTVTNAAPTVTGITPSTGIRGTTVSIMNLAGTGFLSGAAVRLNRTDSTAIPATNVVVASATQITCDFALPAGVTIGTWNVTVTNPDMQNGTLVNGFTVMAAAPAVTGISPNSSLQTTPVLVSVAGSDFQSGANLTLKRTGYPDIIATGVVLVSSNLITGNLNLLTVTPGPWDVVVTNTDGQSGTLAEGFTVRNPTPTVTGITPNNGIRGWTVTITNLAGTNFRSGAVVKLVNASAGPDIEATNVVVVSANQITSTFDLTGANAARRNVTVTNPYSDTGVRANGFTVTNPSLTARNPTSGNRGWPVNIVSLTGTGFLPGADVRLRRTGYSDIIATGVNVASPTSINAGTFDLLGVMAGTWNILVINPDGGETNTVTFTVNSPAPTVPNTPAFSPPAGARGTTGLTVTAPGTNLQPGMAVVLTRGSTTITAYNVNVASPTSVTFTIDIPAGATTGGYTAQYTNTDGRTGSRTNRFQVT
jgi:hypothetical protein